MNHKLVASILALSSTLAILNAAEDAPKAKPESSTKKVLMVVTSHNTLGATGKKTGWFLPEVAHPYFILKQAGIQVDFASPDGGAAPMDEGSRDLNDAQNRRFVEDANIMAQLKATIKASDVKPSDYAAIIFAGGHGTMWDFPENKELSAASAAIYEKGGVVAAVCHGPAALVNTKLSNGKYLVDGKTVSAFTDEEEEAVGLTKVVPFLLATKLIERGAKHVKAANFAPQVSVSERLVTGQNPASATRFGEEIVKLLQKSQ